MERSQPPLRNERSSEVNVITDIGELARCPATGEPEERNT